MGFTEGFQRSTRGGQQQSFVVKSGVTILPGAFVAIEPASGLLVNAADVAGLIPIGFSQSKIVGDGVLRVSVTLGPFILEKVSVAGVGAISEIGEKVFLHGADDLRLAAPVNLSPGLIGHVLQFQNGAVVDVLWRSTNELMVAHSP